jgi:hypothetical protein
MTHTVRVAGLAGLIAGVLWVQNRAPAQAQAGSTATPQDIVGTLELTVRAEVTGRYAYESRQRAAGEKGGMIERHDDDEMTVTMTGTTEWPVKSQDGFDDMLFQIEPARFATSITGQGRISETTTHNELCFAGLNNPRQERWSTNNQDTTWTSRATPPVAGAADQVSVANHLMVTRDTADPDRGMYILVASIQADRPTVAGQLTYAMRSCDENTTTGNDITDNPIGDGGAFSIVTDTLNQASQDAAFTAELQGTFDRHSRGFSVTRHALFTYAPKDEVVDTVEAGRDGGWVRSLEHHEGFVNLTYTLTYRLDSDVDAVIEPEAGYAKWQPEASAGKYKPRPLQVHVRIHKKGAPHARASEPARFRFELHGTSREPGYCLNAPKRPDPHFQPSPPDEPFDLEIGATDNPALKISDKGQRAETKDGLTDAMVLINPEDWGGYTWLTVTAILKDGTEIVAHLASDGTKRELHVPIDDNHNGIADGWEKKLSIFELDLPPWWNKADDPANQLAVGDGISLYEKYRGFEFDGAHKRLLPAMKYLFLFDADGSYRAIFGKSSATFFGTAGLDFTSLSGLEVRLIADKEWTGTGAAAEGHRIINFNHRTGHAVDQHGVHITESSPTPAGFFGYAWRDGRDVFGPPKATLRATINLDAIITYVHDRLEASACALPRPGGPLPAPACTADAIAVAHFVKHSTEETKMVAKVEAQAITHELAHAVGVQHHDAVTDGDHQCVMRYPSEADCPRDPADPVQLKCRTPWPSKLVGPDPRSHAGMGCFRQIVVNDAKYR